MTRYKDNLGFTSVEVEQYMWSCEKCGEDHSIHWSEQDSYQVTCAGCGTEYNANFID